ncbi:MAG: NAD-dependent epimerase/dehydratase family protein [Proteobacteria bacterium]|nr:NAD-dependent epimerase/dehydratase family protein [Pseudomonadota bacterium]
MSHQIDTQTATGVSPADGPVAVTGASGYIGSWIVHDLMKQGYRVRACVRDTSKSEKVDHLLALNHTVLRGQVELFAADLFERGSYDGPFTDCCAVIHTGATVGYHNEPPQQVYDACFTEVRHVVESVKKAGTVKRFVYTSSFSAAWHHRPEGYVFTEYDWCDDNIERYKGAWSVENVANRRDIAYAMGKASTERMIYETSEEDGSLEAMAVLPVHVLGPLMCPNHDQPQSWQNNIKEMLQGRPFEKARGGRMLWNIVDVRDVAKAHRLCAESPAARNGSRYILGAADRSGELFTFQLQARLKELFPAIQEIGGEEMDDGKPVKKSFDSPRAYCLLARQELGLSTHPVNETLKATGDSYIRLGLL